MSTEMNCLENIVSGSFVARGKKVRLKVWGEALWSTGAEKSHSAVSSMSECGETAEAAAEQGEDSCRKDLGGFFFFFYGCYSVKTMGVYMSTAAIPGWGGWIVREVKKKKKKKELHSIEKQLVA